MQYSDEPHIQQALEIVHKYDPEAWQRMQASNWLVSTDTDVLIAVLVSYFHMSKEECVEAVNGCLNANGTTMEQRIVPFLPWNFTFFSLPALRADTVGDHIQDMHNLLATVMRHEFRHLEQPLTGAYGEEADAFTHARIFASRLPAPDGPAILAWNASVRRSELRAVKEGKQG